MLETIEKVPRNKIIISFDHFTDFTSTNWGIEDVGEIKTVDLSCNFSKTGYFLFSGEREILLNVNEKQFKIPYELKNIAEQIEEAKEILSYTDNWDEEGAEPTDNKTFLKAAEFLIWYSDYILRNYSTILITPYVDIMRDGSIYVQWDTPKAKFLIIFKNTDHPNAYFYAEKKENQIPFKSAIEIGKEIDQTIALWMKQNLS